MTHPDMVLAQGLGMQVARRRGAKKVMAALARRLAMICYGVSANRHSQSLIGKRSARVLDQAVWVISTGFQF